MTEVTCCKAWGDPHYLTFGGLSVDFMGPCRYQLTGTCPNTTHFEHFHVTALNSLPSSHPLASYVKEVSVDIAGHRVVMLPDGVVKVGLQI